MPKDVSSDSSDVDVKLLNVFLPGGKELGNRYIT